MSKIKANQVESIDGLVTVDTKALVNTAKAWVNFNGIGTIAIRDSYNVSSITDNGTGTYTVNFTLAMQDNNYSLAGSAEYNQDNAVTGVVGIRGHATPQFYKTAAACRLNVTFNPANGTATADYQSVNAIFFS